MRDQGAEHLDRRTGPERPGQWADLTDPTTGFLHVPVSREVPGCLAGTLQTKKIPKGTLGTCIGFNSQAAEFSHSAPQAGPIPVPSRL